MTTPKWLHRGWLVTPVALALVTSVSCGGSDGTGFSRGPGGKTGDAAATGGSATDGSSGGSLGTATGGSSAGTSAGGGGAGGASTGGGSSTLGGAGGAVDAGDASTSGDSAVTDGAGTTIDAGNCANPTTFYADTDGDKFGDAQSSIKACAKPKGYVENSDDCYDGNASAKPGQTGWFKVDRGDGSYDYDCDKSEAQHWTGAGTCGVGICTLIAEGWQGAAPPCGTEAPYVTMCVGLALCLPQTMPRTQECH